MEKHTGRSLEFMIPSGYLITIREQNGDDDEILSEIDPQNRSRENNIRSVNRFIASLVIHNSKTGLDYMTIKEVEELKLNDKYYILLKTRMHSLGNEVTFEWECDCGKLTAYRDDISKLDRDLGITPLPEADPEAIFPYKNGDQAIVDHTLSSGKRICFKYMDGRSELFILEAGKTAISKNTELYARELKLWDNGKWSETLSRYNVFSSSDMMEIRKLVKDHDSQFNMTTECKCPNCNNVQVLPYNAITGFFFPTEM